MASPIIELEKKVAQGIAPATRNVISSSNGIFGGFQTIRSKTTSYAFFLPLVGGLIGWVAKKLPSRVEGPLTKVSGITKLPNAPMNKLAEEASSIFGAGSSVTNTIANGSKNISEYARNLLGPKIHGALAENSVGTLAVSATVTIGEAANMALSVKHKIETLKWAQGVLSQKVPSSSAVWWGNNLHPLVARLRVSELTGWRALASNLLQIIGVMGNTYMTLFGSRSAGFKGIAKSLAMGMGTSMAANALSAGNVALASCREMHLFFVNRHKMGPDAKAPLASYQRLIGSLVPGAHEETVNILARQAYAQQRPPEDILKMVAETDFSKVLPSQLKIEGQEPAKPAAPVTIGKNTFTSKKEQGPLADQIRMRQPAQGLSVPNLP